MFCGTVRGEGIGSIVALFVLQGGDAALDVASFRVAFDPIDLQAIVWARQHKLLQQAPEVSILAARVVSTVSDAPYALHNMVAVSAYFKRPSMLLQRQDHSDEFSPVIGLAYARQGTTDI